MKSNYKRIGDYIRVVDERNTDLRVENLLGLSITKEFVPSVSNTVGTDMSKYKIVKKNQFVCSTMQVRRDKKMPVAFLQHVEEGIISPAYYVFEVIDENRLLPEYLMMWFSRSEFDREACFYAIGGVRGSLEWEDFCDMKLPVPSIERQREIVKEYSTILNRIKLNEKKIEKLEELGQSIYKKWFIDFEIDNQEYKLNKSSQNKYEYEDCIKKEMPCGWSIEKFENAIELFISNRGKSRSIMEVGEKGDEFRYPVISAMNVKGGKIVKKSTITYANQNTFDNWMNQKLKENDVIMTSEAPLGEVMFIANKKDYILSQRLYGLRANTDYTNGTFLYYWLKNEVAIKDLESRATGTTVLGIKLSELKKVTILKPEDKYLKLFEKMVKPLLRYIEVISSENEILNELKNQMQVKLSKMGV